MAAGEGKRDETRTASAAAMHACAGVLRLICVACAIDWLSRTRGAPAALVAVMAAALAAWRLANAVRPPPPTPCGTPGGPPVTAPRARMRDGRYLAYAESGVSRDAARFKVVYSHGFSGGRMDSPRASQVGGHLTYASCFPTFSFSISWKGMARARHTVHGHMRVRASGRGNHCPDSAPAPGHVGGPHQLHHQPRARCTRLRFVQEGNVHRRRCEFFPAG